MPPGAVLEGPAIVEQLDTTIVIEPGSRAAADPAGNLIVAVGGLARQRVVRTGPRQDTDLVEILEGLDGDEMIITSGLTQLEEGRRVRVRES